jgi:lipopolysaccharide heptosyltransferase II
LKILVVRLREIGDVVFTTPALPALREHFTNARISYLVEPAAAPIVQNNPHLAEVIVAPRLAGIAGLRADLALGRRLRRAQFDIAFDFHGGPRASLLTWLSGAAARIGYVVAGRSWMYTRVVSRPRQLRARHSVENQWDLLAAVGVAPPDPERYPVEMVENPADCLAVGARLAQHGVPADARLAVVHVSAGNPFRRWPLESFAKIAADLAFADAALHVVFTCGPSERDALARVIAGAREQMRPLDRHRIVDCGEFSLSELRSLTERASLYVGGDSGPMHIASAGRAPIVSLYGPTLPARSAPWRSSRWIAEAVQVEGLPCRPCDQRVCVPGDFRCLTQILPGDVVAAASRLLARTDKMSQERGNKDE